MPTRNIEQNGGAVNLEGLETETPDLLIPDWLFVNQPIGPPCQTKTPTSSDRFHNLEALDAETDLMSHDPRFADTPCTY